MIVDFYVQVPSVSAELFEKLGILDETAEVSFESGCLEDATVHQMQRLVSEKGSVRGYFGPRKIYVGISKEGPTIFGDSAVIRRYWEDSDVCREDAIQWQQEFMGFVGKFLKLFHPEVVCAVAFIECRPPNLKEFAEWMNEPLFAVFENSEFRFAVPPNELAR